MDWNSDKLSDGRRNGVNYGFQVTNTDTIQRKNPQTERTCNVWSGWNIESNKAFWHKKPENYIDQSGQSKRSKEEKEGLVGTEWQCIKRKYGDVKALFVILKRINQEGVNETLDVDTSYFWRHKHKWPTKCWQVLDESGGNQWWRGGEGGVVCGENPSERRADAMRRAR